MDQELPASQASSHFAQDPIPASILLDLETARRDALNRKGNLFTGSKELDESVLLGGFERGCVVGVSAEEEDFGLLIGLQTIAHLLAADRNDASSSPPKVMVITTMSKTALLPVLRGVLVTHLASLPKDGEDLNARVKQCFRNVLISPVFDLQGVWETLGELEMGASSTEQEPPPVQAAVEQEQQQEDAPETEESTAAEAPAVVRPPPQRTEIPDSEDEGTESGTETNEEPPIDVFPANESGLASPVIVRGVGKEVATDDPNSSPAPQPEQHQQTSSPPPPPPPPEPEAPLPDIILITHMSTLLNALFTSREKSAAHTDLQLFASHIRYLTRSSRHGGPLIMILNSTSVASSTSETVTTAAGAAPPSPHGFHSRAGRSGGGVRSGKPLDPTLRSIFNPAPRQGSDLGYSSAGIGMDGAAQLVGGTGGRGTQEIRRTKPVFGLSFTQMLDLHLLYTRVPRSRADAEAVFSGRAAAGAGTGARMAWVVEVLLDEIGVWVEREEASEGQEGKVRAKRQSREQRWGAVDVEGGFRVVDAFQTVEKKAPEMIRTVGGFGGPRV